MNTNHLVKTTINYKSGKVKLESVEKRELFNDITVHTDKMYYENGNLKSELKSKYGNPKTNTIGIGQPGKYSLMLYKKYALYYENGKLKEKGKLVKGSGTIQEFNDSGQLIKERKVENFINTERDSVQDINQK